MIIVLFHVFYLLGKFVYNRCSGDKRRLMGDDDPYAGVGAQSKAMKEQVNLQRRLSNDGEESKSTIRFSPPAFIQRYEAVVNVLTDKRYGGKLKKIVDFGCSELGFAIYLKRMIGVEEALFVDIDKNTLDTYKEKTRPLHTDYLHKRSTPLVFRVMEGSVTQHDKSLEGCDAVVCIELVEHLYPEPLTELPFNIFGYIRPKVAIITTPNADFNVLFSNMAKFRHWDHKFEWTRIQFQDWANNIVTRFPEYEVTFHGICDGPPGTESLGACSQMAVFHKSYDLSVEKVTGTEGLYNPVATHEYPFEIDNRSDEQKILDDAVYYIRKFSINEDGLEEEISLAYLLRFMKKYYISSDELKQILQNAGWSVVDRENGPVVLIAPSTVSDDSINDRDPNDFLDHDYPPGYYDAWNEDPGPGADYFSRNDGNDVDVVGEEEWENTPWIENETHDLKAKSEMWDTEEENSTPSIHPDDVCLDDIVTESRSSELDNSAVDDSIMISSFSETKDSDNSENTKNSRVQAQASSIDIDNKIEELSTSLLPHQPIQANDSMTDFTEDSFTKHTSMCSMYLEPSQISRGLYLEDLTDPLLESDLASPLPNKPNKKLKLNHNEALNNVSENTFEDPKYTSSPHVPSSLTSKKRKISKPRTRRSNSNSSSSSNDGLLLCTNESSNEVLTENGSQQNKSSACSNESVIAESNFSSGNSPQTNYSESPEKLRHYTGTIPKSFNGKIPEMRINTQKETKLERISPDTPESPPNSWSPEIMDSGYPNSNSPPDLSPEYDLSSIAHDHSSDSDSPSIADAPRIGWNFDVPEVENRDLANNNLDDEGNHMEADGNQHINDLRPLINVLENDLENENDIYVVRNGFPIWLLRILQRFDAEGMGINLPMLHPPNENYG
ncbi:uncharacterized protein LOC100121690 isoform X2 [Nasonia vitripennis]|nr:uncharacterized protein LOC100121690 isoform X2 [Nasonia vitripennis]